MPRDRRHRLVDERTARLRALRLAAEASRQLDKELLERSGAPKRPNRRATRKSRQAIRVDDLNAANDK
jgi:hypothetical protein